MKLFTETRKRAQTPRAVVALPTLGIVTDGADFDTAKKNSGYEAQREGDDWEGVYRSRPLSETGKSSLLSATWATISWYLLLR